MDRVRGQQMPRIGPTLDYLGVYIGHHLLSLLICVPQTRPSLPRTGSCVPTRGPVPLRDIDVSFSQVRIYQVKKDDPLGRDLRTANAFEQGKKRKRSKPVARRKAIV